MTYTIETTGGCFQACKLRNVVKNMIEFYGSNNQEPEEISSIYFGDSIKTSPKLLQRLQNKIEESVQEWREEVRQNQEELRFLKSDYRANLI